MGFRLCAFSLFLLFYLLRTTESSTKVYVAGSNIYGQLGTTGTYQDQFTENNALDGAIQIAAGFFHTLALFDNGIVKAFGSNINGQLGLGDTIDQTNVPTIIPSINSIKSIYAGYYFSMLISNDNIVYGFGDNSNGQLGIGNTNSTSVPIINPFLNGNYIKKISLSFKHSLVLLNNGSVLGFGNNTLGQLGMGDYTPHFVPTLIPNLNNVIDICAGYQFSLFVLNNGSLLMCGDQSYGKIGISLIPNITIPTLFSNLTNVIKIDCGQYFGYASLSNGSLFSWGNNNFGQLGLGIFNYNFIWNSPEIIPEATNFNFFLLGLSDAFILFQNDSVMSVGRNQYGQLGTGDTLPKKFFTQIPILSSSGTIQLNRTKFISDSSYFIQIVSNQSSSNLVAIVTPIVLFLVISVAAVLLILYFRKRRKFPKLNSTNSIKQSITIYPDVLIEGSTDVYKGNFTGKEIALKKITHKNMNEVQFYQKIDRNPNIVEYFGIYDYGGANYLILELLTSSLSLYFKTSKNCPTVKLIKFIQQLSLCLSYLEDKGIIHGNICCDNILRKGNDKLKLCDFKFTCNVYNPLTISEAVLSRIQFCAPEVKENKKFDKKSDVWSWSVTCIEIFYLSQKSNENPFQMNENMLNSKPSQCPDDLWDLIQKGLASDPNQRPTFKEIYTECPKILKSYCLNMPNVIREEDPYLSTTNQDEIYN